MAGKTVGTQADENRGQHGSRGLANTDKTWLAHVRDLVRSAYRGPDVRIPSLLGDMITRETKEIDTRSGPPKGLTRDERLEWYATRGNRQVTATKSRRPGHSSPILYRFPDGWVLRKIRQLPAKHNRIIHHLYHPNSGQVNVDWLSWHLWGSYEMDGLNSKTKNIISEMIRIQLREMKSPMGWVGVHQEPWEHFGIKRDAWKATYREHWYSVRNLLIALDEEALGLIAE